MKPAHLSKRSILSPIWGAEQVITSKSSEWAVPVSAAAASSTHPSTLPPIHLSICPYIHPSLAFQMIFICVISTHMFYMHVCINSFSNHSVTSFTRPALFIPVKMWWLDSWSRSLNQRFGEIPALAPTNTAGDGQRCQEEHGDQHYNGPRGCIVQHK